MIRTPRGGTAWAFREEEDTQLYEEPIEDVDLPSSRAPSPPRRGFEPVWRGGPVQPCAAEPQEDAIDATQAYGDDPPLHAEVAEEEEGTQLYTEDWLAVSTSRPPVPSFQLASSPIGQESSPVRQGAPAALVTGAVEEEPLVATQMYSESPPEPQSPGAEATRGQQPSPLQEQGMGSPGAAKQSHQEEKDPMTPIRRGPTCSKLQAALAAAGVPLSGPASPCATQSYEEEEEAKPVLQEPGIKAATVAAADSPGGTQLYDDPAEPLTWSNPRKHQEVEAAPAVPSALNDSPPGTQLYEDVPLFQNSPIVAKASAAPAMMADSPCGTQNYDDVPSFWSGSSKATLTLLSAAVGAPDSSQGVATARRGSSQAKLTVLGAPVGAPDSSPGPAATPRNRLQTTALACSALAESPPGTQLYEDVPLFQSSPASSKEAALTFPGGLASSPGATQRQLAGDFCEQAAVPSPLRQSPPMPSPPRTSPPHQSPGSPGATQLYEDSASPHRSPAPFHDQQEVAPQPISPTESICSANSLPAAPKGTAAVTATEEEELADTQCYGGEEAFQARATAFTDTAATQNYEDCEDVPEADEPADATGAAPLQVEAAPQPGCPSPSAAPTPEPEVEAEAPKSDLEEVAEEDAAPPCAEAPAEVPAARMSPQKREEGGSGSEGGKDLVPSPGKAADCERLGRVSTVSTYSGSRNSPASAYSESRSASAQDVLREAGEGGCEATQLYGMDDDCLLEEPPKMATVDAGACSAPPPISKSCAEIFIEATQQYDTLIDHGSWKEMPAEAVQHNKEHAADIPAVREPESTQFYAATQFYEAIEEGGSPMKACTVKECPPPPPRRSLQAVAMEETQFYEEGFASAACTQLYSEDISPIKEKLSEKPLGGSPAGSSSVVVECTQLYSTQLYSEGDHVSPVKEKPSDRAAAGLALDCNVECTQLYSEGDHVSPVRERAPGEPSADLATVVAGEEPARPASPKPPSPCSSKPTPPSRPSLAEQDKAFQLPRARRRQGGSPPQTPAASSVKRPEITPARSPQRQALAQAAGGQEQSRSSTTPLLGLFAQAAKDSPLSAPLATSVSGALQATLAASKAAASGATAATVAAEVAAKRASTPCRAGRARAKKAPEGPAAIAASARAEPAPTSPGAGRNIRATASPSAAPASAALQEPAGEAPPPTKRRRLSGKQSPPEPNPWATKVEEPDVVVLRAKPGRAPKGKRGQQAAVACKVEDDLTAIPAKSSRSKKARASKPPSSQQTASQPSQAQRGSPGDVRDMALGGAKGARGAQPASGSKQGVRRAKRERFVDDDDSDAPRQGGRSSAKSSRTAALPPQAAREHHACGLLQAPAAPEAVQPLAAVQPQAAQALVAAQPLAASPCFVATGLDFAPKYLRALCAIGAEVVEDWSGGVTHLVADTFRRTTKFMCAICVGAQIVVPQYLEACRKASSIVDTAPYVLKDPLCEAAFAKKHALESYSLADALERARSSGPMLASYRVYCEPFVQGFADLKTLVEAAGGKWLSEASEVTADKRTLHIGKVFDAELLREAACTQVLRFNMYRL